MRNIQIEAAGCRFMPVADGAVVTMSFEGTDPICGMVENFKSTDGYFLPVFVSELVDGAHIHIPVVVDDARFKFELVADDIEAFYSSKNREQFFGFYRQVCSQFEWTYDRFLALHCAFWMGEGFRQVVSDANVVQAVEFIESCIDHYKSLVVAPRAAS